jgi:hypothetical protein
MEKEGKGKLEIWNLRLIFLLFFTQLIDLAVSYTVFKYAPNFFTDFEWFRTAVWLFQTYNSIWKLLIILWIAPLSLMLIVVKSFYFIKRKMPSFKIVTIILEIIVLLLLAICNFMHLVGFLSWIR